MTGTARRRSPAISTSTGDPQRKASQQASGTSVRAPEPTTPHTPGPWDDASTYPGIHSVRIFAKTRYIATVGHSDDARAVTEANARLIAAAPELLAALKIDEQLQTYGYTKEVATRLGPEAAEAAAIGPQRLNQWARAKRLAAIAKAEGR